MMTRISTRLAVVLVLGALATPLRCQACLWDRDTLWMETQEFPLALELITGKFRRHSPVYYQWRIERSLAALKTAPEDLSAMDDLGVAYDKLGQHDDAIAIGRKALAMDLDRYESNANLGTFLIHKGALSEGLVYLKRAIAINPDAHFGRERYQIQLVEYVLSRRNAAGELVLPLMGKTSVPLFVNSNTFDRYVLEKDGRNASVDLVRKEARKGLMGMMYFGDHTSPVLLEAFACLLDHHRNGAGQRLAARAFLKASYAVTDEVVAGKYREAALSVLGAQVIKGIDTNDDAAKLAHVEAQFKRELEDAEAWYVQLEAKERAWYEAGKNLEQEYRRSYSEAPQIRVKRTWKSFFK